MMTGTVTAAFNYMCFIESDSLYRPCVDVCSCCIFFLFPCKWQIVPCAWIRTLQFTKVTKMKEGRKQNGTSPWTLYCTWLRLHMGKTSWPPVSGQLKTSASVLICFTLKNWFYVSCPVMFTYFTFCFCFYFMGVGYRTGQMYGFGSFVTDGL